MRAMTWTPLIGAAMMLAACGGEKPAPAKEEAADALKPGLYELTSEVTGLSSTDNTTPATKAKEGDKCEIKNSYIRYGRLSAQMSCKREGRRGEVMPAMMGSFKADSFEGEITSLSYFIEDGDYRMTRKVTAKRVGDCPAGGAAEPAKAS